MSLTSSLPLLVPLNPFPTPPPTLPAILAEPPTLLPVTPFETDTDALLTASLI